MLVEFEISAEPEHFVNWLNRPRQRRMFPYHKQLRGGMYLKVADGPWAVHNDNFGALRLSRDILITSAEGDREISSPPMIGIVIEIETLDAHRHNVLVQCHHSQLRQAVFELLTLVAAKYPESQLAINAAMRRELYGLPPFGGPPSAEHGASKPELKDADTRVSKRTIYRNAVFEFNGSPSEFGHIVKKLRQKWVEKSDCACDNIPYELQWFEWGAPIVRASFGDPNETDSAKWASIEAIEKKNASAALIDVSVPEDSWHKLEKYWRELTSFVEDRHYRLELISGAPLGVAHDGEKAGSDNDSLARIDLEKLGIKGKRGQVLKDVDRLYRLVKGQQAIRLYDKANSRRRKKSWREIAEDVNWLYGTTEAGVKKLTRARDDYLLLVKRYPKYEAILEERAVEIERRFVEWAGRR